MEETHTILIVEENRVIQIYLKQLIKSIGYKIQVVSTFAQMREKILSCRFDFVMLAMDLPGDVEAMVEMLMDENIAVILLKGSEKEPLRRRLIQKNIIGYVDKHRNEDCYEILQMVRQIEKNQTQKIMVIKGDATVQSDCIRILRMHRFALLESKNADEALVLLLRYPEIKLVVIDSEITDAKIVESISVIREKFDLNTLPIVCIAENESKTVITELLNQKANDYLTKPYTPQELLYRLNGALSHTENIKELKEKRHLLKHYEETIDKFAIVSMSDESGFITYVSEAFEQISGYSKKEIIGRTHAVFRHPDTSNRFYTKMWRNLNAGEAWDGEVKNRRKDGKTYWLKLHIEPQRDVAGHLIGYSSIGHDITDKIHLKALSKELESRVRIEVERNRLQTAQMIEQSRLAQMGEMISMIAHQWRQPLASISAISSTLTLDVMLEEYNQAFFEERLSAIGDLAQYLSSTIDDFRGFFKTNKITEKTSWALLAEGSLRIIEPTLQAHDIKVERDYQCDELFHTYGNEVRQVLLNIFKNAEDIFLENKGQNSVIWVRSYQKGSMVCLSIEDSGGGIPDTVIGKIFDPYFSTKLKKDGTGLGLYMSKTIIEEHCKGTLSVQNTEKGALFEIALPIVI